MNKFLYIPAFLLLTALYYFNYSSGVQRLPWYYFPDGTVLHIGDNVPQEKITKIYKINDEMPSAEHSVMNGTEIMEVASEKGNHLVLPIAVSFEEILGDFMFPILFSYIFLFAGVWFRHSGNDWHISVFCFLVSILIFLSINVLLKHTFVFSWQVLFFSLPAFLLNVGFRVTGKHLSSYLLLFELILTIFIALVAYVGKNYDYTLYNLRIISWYLTVFTSFLVSAFLLDELIKKENDPIEKLKEVSLFICFFGGLFLPFLMFQFSDTWYESGNIFLYPSLLLLIFPAGLLYGTYRIYLVPFQFIITKSLLAALLTVMLMGIYGIVLLVHSILLPEQEQSNQWIVNLIFVLSLVFFLDPAKRKISSMLESRLFRLSPELTESLERIASTLSTPIKSSHSVEFFLDEITAMLKLEEAGILFSENTFPDLSLKHHKFYRIKDSSNLWKHLLPDKMVVASYLTYSGGSRQGLYRFLYNNNIYLAMGVIGNTSFNHQSLNIKKNRMPASNMKAAILLGYKKNHRRYELSEIRYLQEASRLASMMVEDYALLIREIEKRKKMRELSAAREIQKSFTNLEQTNIESLKISSFNIPAISVSGDYLDMIVLSPVRVVFLLGDVSGHGLGTGYLVSVVRSIVRSHLEAGASITETFDLLNQFLIKRYKGHEYLTMLAFDLNTETGEIEIINAAHPSPFLYDPEDDTLTRFSTSQKLLGALPASYHSNQMRIKRGQRLFLFSDGVTETFNTDDRAFGEDKLMKFFHDNRHETLDVINVKLKDLLYDFRGGSALPSDDTTFFAVEYSHLDYSIRSLFSGISKDETHKTES